MDEQTQEPQATLGGEPESTPEPSSAQEPAEYVVQMHMGGPPTTHWVDIATVKVSPRTRRKSVLEKALIEAGDEHKPTVDHPAMYRVLDAQSFEGIPASLVQPEPSEPVLRIG
jgi:hypothetical protein